jgi:hypothetical protein
MKGLPLHLVTDENWGFEKSDISSKDVEFALRPQDSVDTLVPTHTQKNSGIELLSQRVGGVVDANNVVENAYPEELNGCSGGSTLPS